MTWTGGTNSPCWEVREWFGVGMMLNGIWEFDDDDYSAHLVLQTNGDEEDRFGVELGCHAEVRGGRYVELAPE